MLNVRQLALVAITAVVLLVTTVGCGAIESSGSPPEDLLFVIPAGTAAARMRGEPPASFPSEIPLVAGQSITVRNEDTAMHYFFYAPIAPGQSFRKTFPEPGRYGYSGALSCSIAEMSSLTVDVAERTASR